MAWSVAVVSSAQCMESMSPAESSKRLCSGASFSNSVPRARAIQSSSSRMASGVRSTPFSARTATVVYSS
jgi:hypothetical protein